jgi:transposase-like protein
MVRTLRAELGTEHGTVNRVARQLGYGVESVRSWVRQADIDDGYAPGVSTAEAQRVKELEQEIRELKRANEILKRANAETLTWALIAMEAHVCLRSCGVTFCTGQ